MKIFTLGREEYSVVLNRVQADITTVNPARMPKLKRKLRRKPNRAALLMDSKLLAPGVYAVIKQ
ncbi:hypothetical protein HMPREF0262_02166 [Clostridium sp. ATCC 29733]|nr:hypothetical protein HMPREF0262_02166 [Clostridium sp. ATCC 29733]